MRHIRGNLDRLYEATNLITPDLHDRCTFCVDLDSNEHHHQTPDHNQFRVKTLNMRVQDVRKYA